MDVSQIVKAIELRRAEFWDRQTVGDASDPAVYSESDLARAIADEYTDLLKEIGETKEPKIA